MVAQSSGQSCRRTYSLALALAVCAVMLGGCYAPLRTPAIPAHTLPDEFRTPMRTAGPLLNYANLTVRSTGDYKLGPGDVLEVSVPDLYPGAEIRPLRVQIMADGKVTLPLIAPLNVMGANLSEAQQAISAAYGNGILENPRINVILADRSTVEVLVLGEVMRPGVHVLVKNQNDVGHALASAGGLARDAAEIVEVHRRIDPGTVVDQTQRMGLEEFEETPGDPKKVIKIPLRGLPPGTLSADDVTLGPGDVVVIPSRKNEVFFVVGRLNQTNLVRFSLGDRERELGTGLILPRDREIDVVQAVAMAGYVDPIDSPMTVSVQRTLPDGCPMLIRVDLIRARYDRAANIYVHPGDIIYVNPDFPWWFRRTLDRIIPDLFLLPYARAVN